MCDALPIPTPLSDPPPNQLYSLISRHSYRNRNPFLHHDSNVCLRQRSRFRHVPGGWNGQDAVEDIKIERGTEFRQNTESTEYLHNHQIELMNRCSDSFSVCRSQSRLPHVHMHICTYAPALAPCANFSQGADNSRNTPYSELLKRCRLVPRTQTDKIDLTGTNQQLRCKAGGLTHNLPQSSRSQFARFVSAFFYYMTTRCTGTSPNPRVNSLPPTFSQCAH